jgi:hypothetical protein
MILIAFFKGGEGGADLPADEAELVGFHSLEWWELLAAWDIHCWQQQ